VVLDAETHTRLAAAAALRGCDRSTLAAQYIRAGVSRVVVFDKSISDGSGDDEDRPKQGLGIISDADDEAA
jgi:hypothetical protein